MTPDTPAAGTFDRLAGNRQTVAVLLFAVAALWAVPAAVAGVKFVRAVAANKDADKPEADKDPAATRLEAGDPNQYSYLVTGLLCFGGALTAAAGGVFFLASLPPRDPARARAHVRSVTLLVGGLSGLFLMLLGVWFFIDQYAVLSEWLNGTRPKQAWKPIVALLLFAAGAGLGFAAGLPARAEERNNQTLRRLVYGSGLVLTTLLLVMALVIGNVVAGVRLPNRLDTTQSGLFAVDPSTEQFVQRLDRPVTVYAFLPTSSEEPLVRNTRSMLISLQETNPAKFRVRFYSQALGRGADRADLTKRFPQADPEEFGLILAVGEDEARYSFVRATDLVKRDADPRGRGPGKEAYQGERVLVRELQFLADDKQKAAVYFTTGSGELDPGPEARPERSAAQLKAYLQKNNIDVRPLPLDAADARVPDDAAIVVVLDPNPGLAPAAAGALREYMARPGKDGGKKGKLILAVGPHEAPGGGTVRPSGTEELLGEFGMRPRDSLVYTLHQGGDYPLYMAVAGVTQLAADADNPIAKALTSAVLIPKARPIDMQPAGGPQSQTTPLLVTVGNTWVEDREPANFQTAVNELLRTRDARTRKQWGRPQVLAAVAGEGPSGRLVAIGSGNLFSDEHARRYREANPGAQFLSLAIDYLRDRPTPDIAVKDYSYYTPKPEMGLVPLLLVPLGLAVLAVAGLGAGVWVIRRK